MLTDDLSKQAEKTPENTGNFLLTVFAIVAAAATATVGSLFGLHAIGASENKNKNRASKACAWLQRNTGNEEDAQRTEKQMVLHNVATGAKVIANKVGDCASAAGTVVGACVKHLQP